MNVLELTSCIPYALGHPRILGVSALHEIERKMNTRSEMNFDGRFSEELP